MYYFSRWSSFCGRVEKIRSFGCFSLKEDETSLLHNISAAVPHYLEAWGDYEFKAGNYALAQPTIRPLFDTKQFQDVLLYLDRNSQTYYDAIQDNWSESILGSLMEQVLHDGFCC